MITYNKALAQATFANHLKIAKAACILAGGVETPVDSLVDDLARCLDTLHGTDEFMKMAAAN